jgi:hypothetical protein
MVARAQWLKAGLANGTTIIRIKYSEAELANAAAVFFRDNNLCTKYGCPNIPIITPSAERNFDHDHFNVKIFYSEFSSLNVTSKNDLHHNHTVRNEDFTVLLLLI